MITLLEVCLLNRDTEHPDFDLDGLPSCVPREPLSLSDRLGFARHYYDGI